MRKTKCEQRHSGGSAGYINIIYNGGIKMKRKLVSMALMVTMIGSVLAGCGSSSSATSTASSDTATSVAEAGSTDTAETSSVAEASDAAESVDMTVGDLTGKKIYGIYKAGDQTWFINEGDAAKAAVEAAGGSFTYVDAKMSPEECLKAVDNAISNKADGIIICVPDQTMSQSVVDKCDEAGIPVVACDDALEVNDEKIAPWVGIDAYAIGEENGKWLADYANENDLAEDDSVGLLIMTMDTVSSCVPRAQGEEDAFKENCPDFDTSRIFKADNDGTTDKGNTAATAVITAHPEITTWLVTGANEECTIGATRALETAGLDKDSVVVGLGAYMAKDEWNNKGADGTCMKASTFFSADQVGQGSVAVISKLIAGEDVNEEQAVSATMVTPENYKEVMGKYAE